MKTRFLALHGKTLTVAMLIAWASSGCGSDGPTNPEPLSLSELFGTQLFRADGTSVGLGALEGKDIIGIYFASPGCPACGGFNPTLVDAYNQLGEDGRSFEVVLVTLGTSLSALFEYMSDSGMPWLALSPESSRANALAQRYNIRWVPTLVIIDETGKTLSLTGREELTEDGPAAYDEWVGK